MNVLSFADVIFLACGPCGGGGLIGKLLLILGPLLLLILLLVYFMRKFDASKQMRLVDRSFEHIERMEEKTDEMIALLKAIKEQLERRM